MNYAFTISTFVPNFQKLEKTFKKFCSQYVKELMPYVLSIVVPNFTMLEKTFILLLNCVFAILYYIYIIYAQKQAYNRIIAQ